MSDTCIMAVSGPSGSGKSLFTNTLVTKGKELGFEIPVICEDQYYKDQAHLTPEQRLHTNYDHPNAFDHHLLINHIKQLKSGQKIATPEYCYNTHTRKSVTKPINPNSVVLVEGILLFADPELRKAFDIKVFIDTPLDICLLRRIQRDVSERGRSIESVCEQYQQFVKPMYHQFIQPTRDLADIVVTQGGRNLIALEIFQSHLLQQLK